MSTTLKSDLKKKGQKSWAEINKLKPNQNYSTVFSLKITCKGIGLLET